MNKILLLILFFVTMLTSYVTSAHHSFSATFIADDKITVQGTVTNFSFKNPHVLLYFNVTSDDGSTKEWVSEGAAATNMRRRGWSKDSFSAGQIVRVTGDRTHDGSPMTSIDTVQILNANGDVVEELAEAETQVVDSNGGAMGGGMGGGMAGQQENFVKAAPMALTLDNDYPNLTGAWTRHGMGLGRPVPPTVTFNQTGQAAQALFTEAVDPQVFCDAPGLIRQAGMTPHPVRITQLSDRVVFEWEEYGGRREVFFDDRDAKGYKTHLGDGIARYENGALIVETTNLLSNPSSPEGQILSADMTTTETYTRVDSDKYGPVLRVQMSAKDPEWVEGELIFDGLKMSAGEYEFIENDCQTPLRDRVAVHPSTSFFITSVGVSDGANLGGLEGADAHCEMLASKMNVGGKDWRAYLSTTGENGVNARDRIGNGPWYNVRGIAVASSIENLHSEQNNLTKETGISETAGVIPGRGDDVNKHDILTGSLMDGRASTDDADTTCGNWTSSSEDGSAYAGHYDRAGGGDNPESWNQAHLTRGCSQENLQGTGGDGLFYCFASIADTTAIDVNTIKAAVGPATAAEVPVDSPTVSEPVVSSVEEDKGLSPLAIAGSVLLLIIGGIIAYRRKGSN